MLCKNEKIDAATVILVAEAKALMKWESTDFKVDAEGRPLFGYDVMIIDPDFQPLRLRVQSSARPENLVVGGPVRLVGFVVEVYGKRDGQVGVLATAEKIVASSFAQSASKPIAS
ncbi:MAG: hypothetical protein ACYDHP_13355 [Ferrimicrobium sp.]